MAIVGETRLFPPILDTYFPAVVINTVEDGIEIPFEINNLNSLSDIKAIHVMITRQSNYKSLYNNDYPLGIYVIEVPWDPDHPEIIPSILVDKKILVPSSIINSSQLSFNEYYKVQLRFSKDPIGAGEIGGDLSRDLLDEANMAQFSEWSRVGLLRFISEPTFVIQGNTTNEDKTMQPDNSYHLESHYIEMVGEWIKSTTKIKILDKYFYPNEDNEYLSTWRIEIQDENDEVLLDSGEQEVNVRGAFMNQFNYDAPFYFETSVPYKVVLYIKTANLYETSYVYLVDCEINSSTWGLQDDIDEYTSLDSVIGKVNVTFTAKSEDVSGPFKLTIRRGSVEDDFSKWNVIWSKSFAEGEVLPHEITTPLCFDDFTIESGTIYKYNISYETGSDIYEITEGPILSVFDHAFITGEGTQLCVKFNPNINTYKINVSDGVTTTIGGKYPYIIRNGNMYYRSFGLSGTIAYEMDAEHQFATRSSIYGEWINVYGSYFVNRYINQRNDRITQRKFRELVMEYFYDDVPKLFRSTPEGNILVRLTDVTLTPKQELARMIYDFSCTATEIGDCTIDNYKLYQIQDFGDL